ncbi:uncharacterized protein LOC121990688 [Zingiber officinale]|uniref:GIR1-like zinc ribbon domain-containing protein n=1 Tax=Zingiber officinale TaxID=94328 RepID=A0A8J5KSB6_ZINOF|nr:uncharacterized protein LOC121990688 [Zingiber officinale]KAG6498233.1 hypothetical protein ZIOFF_046145 [Zingiber officinale]
MDVVVGSIAGKTDLITLDLLGAKSAPKDLDPADLKVAPFADIHKLDLNLAPAGALNDAAGLIPGCQSVCTIEKVKWALEQAAERETRGGRESEQRQRRDAASDVDGGSPSSSSSSSVTVASVKRRAECAPEGADDGRADGGDSAGGGGGSLVAVGCTSCLSYVLISKGDPRCPRCDGRIAPNSLPAALSAALALPQSKKPRIDLNFSL